MFPSLSKTVRAAGLSVLLGSLTAPAFASHLMGGELFIRHLSGNNYEVQLVQYRDTNSAAFDPSMPYQIIAADASGNPTILVAQDTLIFQPTYSTYPLQSSVMVMERGVSTDTIQLTAPNKYWVATSECCRNGNLSNMTSPATTSMLLMANVTVPATGSNSAPLFLVPPMTFLARNVPVHYNPLPYDLDGDSLAWSLSVPRAEGPGIVNLVSSSMPVQGFTTPPAASGNPLALNPVTGAVSWTPSQPGFFAQSITVEKYRNGVKMGSTSRDFHYIVTAGSSANVPALTVSAAGYPLQYDTTNDYYTIEYTPGQPFMMSVSGLVTNQTPPMKMDAYTALYGSANPPQLTTLMFPTGLTGSFTWNPPAGFTQDVWVVVRMNNNQLASDVTVLLKANPNASGVSNTPLQTTTKLYPNPNKGTFSLDLKLTANAHIKAVIFNSMGQQVDMIYEGEADATKTLSYNKPLAKGIYFVRVEKSGSTAETMPFVVQ